MENLPIKRASRWEVARTLTGQPGPFVLSAVGAGIGVVLSATTEALLGVAPEQWATVWRVTVAGGVGAIGGAVLAYPFVFVWNLLRGRRIAAEAALRTANESAISLAQQVNNQQRVIDSEFIQPTQFALTTDGKYRNAEIHIRNQGKMCEAWCRFHMKVLQGPNDNRFIGDESGFWAWAEKQSMTRTLRQGDQGRISPLSITEFEKDDSLRAHVHVVGNLEPPGDEGGVPFRTLYQIGGYELPDESPVVAFVLTLATEPAIPGGPIMWDLRLEDWEFVVERGPYQEDSP